MQAWACSKLTTKVRIPAMRIYVCVKHVPDTAANIKITNDTGYRPEKFYWAVVTFTASPSNSLNEKGRQLK